MFKNNRNNTLLNYVGIVYANDILKAMKGKMK